MEALESILCALASQAIETQERWDDEYRTELARFAPLYEESETIATREICRALAPARLQISELELDVRLAIELTTTKGLEIKATPLNLGYDLRHRTEATTDSRIKLTVAQGPPRTHPSNNTNKESQPQS